MILNDGNMLIRGRVKDDVDLMSAEYIGNEAHIPNGPQNLDDLRLKCKLRNNRRALSLNVVNCQL